MNSLSLLAFATAGVALVAGAIAFAGAAPEVAGPAIPEKFEQPDARNNPTMDKTLVPTGQAAAPEVKLQYATFAAGCFWGVEETFRETPGVIATAVGYAGGSTDNPTYKQVCSDTTGHAEVVHLQFDPARVSYEQLLDIFWANHNPTTLNRQGPDVGSQYRSAVMFHDEAQKATAEKSKAALGASGKWGARPIVTEVVPFAKFFKAEDYHQQYLAKRGMKACH